MLRILNLHKIERMNNQSTLKWFRATAFIEGISYIVLIFIAMPMKYFAEMDWAVKYTGSAHGALFVLYCILLLMVWKEYKWSFKEVVIAFLLSLIPFGTFFLDKKLKKQLQANTTL